MAKKLLHQKYRHKQKHLIYPAISSKMTCSKSTKTYGQNLLRVKCFIQNQNHIFLILLLMRYQILNLNLNIVNFDLNLILVQCL